MALLKDLWNFDQTLSQPLFYSEFSTLNDFYNISNATPEILKNLQIENLRKSYGNKAAYAQLNQFLQEMMGSNQGTEEDLFAKLVQGINKGLDEFRKNENKENPDWNKKGYYDELNGIIQEINMIVNQASGNEGIPAPSLDAIKKAVGYHKYSDFIAAKGQYLEDLGKWVMQRAGLAGFQTGAWQATDKFFGETSQASIIEDAMGLLLDGVEDFEKPLGNFITVKAKGYNKVKQHEKVGIDSALQDWVNSIKELNGATVLNGRVQIGSNVSSPAEFARLMRLIENNPSAEVDISVSLSDNLYQEIQKLTVNIQAKSNVERHLANAGNRSLYHMDPSDNYYNKWLAFSYTDPVINQTAVSNAEQNAQYPEFAAYVNYNLSKNINNTVYGRNEYYLTTEGFTDLATLMQQRGFYIRIADSTLSYMQFLANNFKTIYQ